MLNFLDFDLNELKTFINNNSIYLFGVGIQGKRWMYVLEDWNLNHAIAGFIDNDCNKWGIEINI